MTIEMDVDLAEMIDEALRASIAETASAIDRALAAEAAEEHEALADAVEEALEQLGMEADTPLVDVVKRMARECADTEKTEDMRGKQITLVLNALHISSFGTGDRVLDAINGLAEEVRRLRAVEACASNREHRAAFDVEQVGLQERKENDR